jgi:hypothetical protein
VGGEHPGARGERCRQRTMWLKPGNEAIYKEKHDHIWPEMLHGRTADGELRRRKPPGHLAHERRADRLLNGPGEQPLPRPGGVDPGQAGHPGR